MDSGAQMTIMSLGCATPGFERLIDRRFQGTAKAWARRRSSKVHQAPITIADVSMPCAITVLEKEQDMDFIFGLDMLKRHQCCVDLEKNELSGVQGKAVPFLGEHALPASAKALTGEDEARAGDDERRRRAAAGSGPAETEAAGLSGSAATVAGGVPAGSMDASPPPPPPPARPRSRRRARRARPTARRAEALEAAAGTKSRRVAPVQRVLTVGIT